MMVLVMVSRDWKPNEVLCLRLIKTWLKWSERNFKLRRKKKSVYSHIIYAWAIRHTNRHFVHRWAVDCHFPRLKIHNLKWMHHNNKKLLQCMRVCVFKWLLYERDEYFGKHKVFPQMFPSFRKISVLFCLLTIFFLAISWIMLYCKPKNVSICQPRQFKFAHFLCRRLYDYGSLYVCCFTINVWRRRSYIQNGSETPFKKSASFITFDQRLMRGRVRVYKLTFYRADPQPLRK